MNDMPLKLALFFSLFPVTWRQIESDDRTYDSFLLSAFASINWVIDSWHLIPWRSSLSTIDYYIHVHTKQTKIFLYIFSTLQKRFLVWILRSTSRPEKIFGWSWCWLKENNVFTKKQNLLQIEKRRLTPQAEPTFGSLTWQADRLELWGH